MICLQHDNRSRDDMTFWERKQMFLKTGRYPSRGFRGGEAVWSGVEEEAGAWTKVRLIPQVQVPKVY